MVQMKDGKKCLKSPCGYLYIPHGSDESWYKAHLRKFKIKLYIPHGSDESRNTVYKTYRLCDLYIPHGSDERLEPL